MITEDELLHNSAFKKLLPLRLNSDDYIIIGLGIMFDLGIRDLASLDDIDIMVSKEGWNKVKGLAKNIHDDKWNCDHLYLFDNIIEIYNGWEPFMELGLRITFHTIIFA